MAVVSNQYTGNGSTTTYSFTFPYLASTDVKVKVNGTTQATTEYTLPTATTLQFNTAPANGSTILIFRDTNNDAKKATFYPGSAIKAEDLNNDFDQILYTAQEVDAFAFSSFGDDPMLGDLSLGNNKLINVGTPTAGTDGVNKTYVDTNTWDTGAETYTSGETWTGNNTTIATSGAIDARIDNKVDIALEGDVLAGTDLSKSASGGQVTINHNVTGANSTVNNSNGNVLQDITVTAQGHVTSVGSTDLDGRYYTETELDAGQLDNRYYTETEVDANFYKLGSLGEIQSGETWSAADNKIATTAAIDARIVDLVDEVGGFVPIDNETSFPNTNPDVNNGTGTLVSIKALSSNLVSNGSGVATITNGTVGNSTVTITGLANSTTYSATFGMIVETTSTLNTYTFHRLTPKATELTTVAGIASAISTAATNVADINNFSDVYQISTSAPTTRADNTALQNGDLWFDSSSNKVMMVYDSSSGDGFSATSPNQSQLTDISIVAGDITYSNDLGAITESIATGTGGDISTVADDIANVNTVAGITSNISTVAGISSNITAVAGNSTNINAVAGNATNINTVSSNNTNINTVAAANSNISTVAAANANIATVAGNNSNINTVASNNTNITTVAGNNTNINTVAGANANINTVAGSIADVNRYANEYTISNSSPGSPSAGDLWYDSSNNILKYYTGSAFSGIISGLTDVAADTTPELGGHLDCNDKNLTEVGTVSGNNLQIDFGTL